MSHSKRHDALFQPGATYLSRECDCGPRVLIEPQRRFGLTGEIPDVFGYRNTWDTYNVDAKATRDDAQEHVVKDHVRKPELGMGRWRYLLCREYIVEPTDSFLPQWMGLLWVGDSGVYEVREAMQHDKRAVMKEFGLALTAWTKQAWLQVGGQHNQSGKSRQPVANTDMAKIARFVKANQPCTAGDIRRALPSLPHKTNEALRKAMVQAGFEHSVDTGVTYFRPKKSAATEAA